MKYSPIFCTALIALAAQAATAATFTVFTTYEPGGTPALTDFVDQAEPGALAELSLTRLEEVGDGILVEVDLSARADLGGVGVAGELRVTSLAQTTGPGASDQARLFANIRDTLTFGIDTGTLILPVDVAGSIRIDSIPGVFGGSVQGQPSGFTSTQLTLVADQRDVFTIFDRREDVSAVGARSLTFNEGALGVTTLAIPFTDGRLDILLSLGATLFCSGGGEGGSLCVAGADFFNSARFLAASVADASGALLAAPTITSSSGFDYLRGLDPHDPVSAVPAPAPLLLLVSGLAAFGALRRRRGEARRL